jgi:hypothetical protein
MRFLKKNIYLNVVVIVSLTTLFLNTSITINAKTPMPENEEKIQPTKTPNIIIKPGETKDGKFVLRKTGTFGGRAKYKETKISVPQGLSYRLKELKGGDFVATTINYCVKAALDLAPGTYAIKVRYDFYSSDFNDEPYATRILKLYVRVDRPNSRESDAGDAKLKK